MINFIEKLKNNADSLDQWYKDLIKDEPSDFILKETRQDLLRIKAILNPDSRREDLLVLDILNDPQIRTIALFEFFAHRQVGVHNHKNTSYMNDKHEMSPVDNRPYKSTHFTFETNPLAYMTYQGRNIQWEKNVFNEYDLVENDHSAVNDGDTSIKFLYIDYYE